MNKKLKNNDGFFGKRAYDVACEYYFESDKEAIKREIQKLLKWNESIGH